MIPEMWEKSLHVSADNTLGRHIQKRREQLGLSIEDASYVAGISVFQWSALESGWIPEPNSNYLAAVAGVLQISFRVIVFLADISRTHLTRPA